MNRQFVWVPSQTLGFEKAELLDSIAAEKQDLSVSLCANGEKKLVRKDDVMEDCPDDYNAEDLCKLNSLNNAMIFQTIKTRYGKDLIYTSCGETLMAVNPFKVLNVYTPEIIQSYQNDEDNTSPHIFLVGKRAMDRLRDGKSQSIVISGESGSGKTESAKFLMKYLTYSGGTSESLICKKIEESNPLLEAFGNAKTTRNDNSSRFGKFITIQFDDKLQICGAKIETYLLEKSRVTNLSKKERNYHIFYQLLASDDEDLKERLNVNRPPESFQYLKSCFFILIHPFL